MKEFVEKLIKRLEGRIKYNELCHEEFPNAKMSLTYEVQINAYKNAIGIVNQLAEEYNNGVCEWRKENSNKYVCNAHAEIHDSRVLDWCVCPYCDKKIKVVE